MAIELIIQVTWWYQQVHGNTCSASDQIINTELSLHLDKKHPAFPDFIRSASIITNRRITWLKERTVWSCDREGLGWLLGKGSFPRGGLPVQLNGQLLSNILTPFFIVIPQTANRT